MSKGKPPQFAFTTRYNQLTNILHNKVTVGDAYNPSQQKAPTIYKEFECIWDTGATNSVITSNVINALQLKPTGKATCHHAGGTSVQDTYLIAIMLPNKAIIPAVKVTNGNIFKYDLLIGMDIIGAGDFAVTKEDGNTVLSYQYPSGKTIDFVKRINAIQPVPRPVTQNHPALHHHKKRKKGRKR